MPLVNETCPRWKSHEWCHEHDTWHHCLRCNLVIDDQEDYNLSLDRAALDALVYAPKGCKQTLDDLEQCGKPAVVCVGMTVGGDVTGYWLCEKHAKVAE